MGGEIGVQSDEGKGSRFYFSVKLKGAKYKVLEEVEGAPKDAPSLSDHILVAEDNLTNQKVVGAMVRAMGCTFSIVNSGAEAIEALKRVEFDLVLMDGQMPVMDGYEATRRIRQGEAGETNKKIPIVAVTANAIKGDLERCLEAGMDDYVSKPILQGDLHAKIRKWLENSDVRSLDRQTLDSMRELETTETREDSAVLLSLIEAMEREFAVVMEEMSQYVAA